MKPTAHNFEIWNSSGWRGACAGADGGDNIPLHRLRPYDRADPEFMRAYFKRTPPLPDLFDRMSELCFTTDAVVDHGWIEMLPTGSI
jgi:hypothetical protein